MREIHLAIKLLGGLKKASVFFGISQQAVFKWCQGEVPTSRCPSIEKETAGKVTCESLRPDVKWERVKDRKWPHPKGRPLVDHA